MSGVISSINTNSTAMVALASLTNIQSQLSTVQTAVSTGYRVSSAVQDGAAYAVAQSVRSSVAGLTSANQALGGAQGMLATANAGLNTVSNLMSSMHATLVELSSGSITGSQRTQYSNQLTQQIQTASSDLSGSNYNGTNLINGVKFSTSIPSVTVSSDEKGTQIKLTGFGGQSLIGCLNSITFTATAAAAALTASGTFTNMTSKVGSALNTLGNATNLVSNQITFNQSKIDALNNGVGALVDANMAQESAKLQSLQIQQQLATSALSIANQSPSLLTKLFP